MKREICEVVVGTFYNFLSNNNTRKNNELSLTRAISVGSESTVEFDYRTIFFRQPKSRATRRIKEHMVFWVPQKKKPRLEEIWLCGLGRPECNASATHIVF